MRRRTISPIRDFDPSVAALQSPLAAGVVQALLQRVAHNAECGRPVEGANLYVIHTRGFDACPALTLVYTFDDKAVYPLQVKACDLALVL
jgi:hypothetical protein